MQSQKRRQTVKRRGFTDKLYFLNFIITWVFVAVCVVLTIISQVTGYTDLQIVSVGIPAAFAELSVHTGFIIHKARVENLAKHNKLEDATVNID